MLYPTVPTPSSISAPAIIDEAHSFVSDSGYETRRARHSRPRRRFTLEYLGKTTAEMRVISDFLMAHRFGSGQTFEWVHITAFDIVPALNTTPIILNYQHGLVTGMYINIGTPAFLAQPWRITRLNPTMIALDGTVASGATNVSVYTYLPYAVARMSEDTWESAVKLIGPEQLGTAGGRTGFFNFSVSIEEVF